MSLRALTVELGLAIGFTLSSTTFAAVDRACVLTTVSGAFEVKDGEDVSYQHCLDLVEKGLNDREYATTNWYERTLWWFSYTCTETNATMLGFHWGWGNDPQDRVVRRAAPCSEWKKYPLFQPRET